jgi:ubiquinone/menaquinone biosynthesis C-methylase UbiE
MKEPETKPKGLAKIWREVKRPFKKMRREVQRPFRQLRTAMLAPLMSELSELKAELARSEQINNLLEQNQDILAKLHNTEPLILEQVSRVLSVYALHQKVFPKYKNINQGKDVVIVATGPSLKDYEPIENAIHIGVNRAVLYDKVKLDYYFVHDYDEYVKQYIQDAINYKNNHIKKFFGILEYQFPKNFIPESKVLEAGAERYYTRAGDDTLPYDLCTSALPAYGTIVLNALLFAFWTNPKRIYLVGCDCTDAGYYGNSLKNTLNFDTVFNAYSKLKDYARIYYPDTEMISINPVGLEGTFKDIYAQSGKYVESPSVDYYKELLKSDDYTTSFLKKNRDERMDANRTDIFSPERTAFHLDRYVFASQYINSNTVVDVASGTGYGADFMASCAQPVKIYGLELDTKAVAYAKSKYQSNKVEFQQGSITDMPFPDDFCDVLTSFETLEHVEDEHQQLREIQRVLKPGGYYIFSTPNKWGLDKAPYHVRDYDYDSVRELVSQYFAIEGIYNQNSGCVGRAENREQPRAIVPTTQDNHHLAECFIIVARNVKNNVVINPNDKIIPTLKTTEKTAALSSCDK